ncbi:hypothetical protein QP445_09550 [Micrococcus luteus]|nr:hypothetical protein [Micrococcus luteus]
MTAPEMTAYPFTSAEPPTVSDFETALGVLAYVRTVRDVASPAASHYQQTRDMLVEAATQVRQLAPFLAVPDAEDHTDHDESEEVPA